jgi:hypothetical protein
MSDRKRREDIQHQVKFLSGRSLRNVWDLVQQEIHRHNAPLWNSRPKDYTGSPAEYIRAHYGSWQEGAWKPDEYTWALVKQDKSLYAEYQKWRRRNPQDKLPTSRL